MIMKKYLDFGILISSINVIASSTAIKQFHCPSLNDYEETKNKLLNFWKFEKYLNFSKDFLLFKYLYSLDTQIYNKLKCEDMIMNDRPNLEIETQFIEDVNNSINICKETLSLIISPENQVTSKILSGFCEILEQLLSQLTNLNMFYNNEIIKNQLIFPLKIYLQVLDNSEKRDLNGSLFDSLNIQISEFEKKFCKFFEKLPSEVSENNQRYFKRIYNVYHCILSLMTFFRDFYSFDDVHNQQEFFQNLNEFYIHRLLYNMPTNFCFFKIQILLNCSKIFDTCFTLKTFSSAFNFCINQFSKHIMKIDSSLSDCICEPCDSERIDLFE